jgi:hypothetical protein
MSWLALLNTEHPKPLALQALLQELQAGGQTIDLNDVLVQSLWPRPS